nr:BREX-2 system phosphatase PglZ [Rhodopirellula sp. JC639]
MKAPGEIEFSFGTARVLRADTVFEIREALLEAEKAKNRIVVLTGLQQNDLGHDVVGRLARSRLFPVDHWASLCAMFKAKELDRSICEAPIAQALMEYAPPDGYPPVSAGVLDSGTVWRAICRHVFDMGEREPDLVSLLLWAASEQGATRYEHVPDDVCQSLRRRLVHNLGNAAESILRFIESNAGRDAIALAVTCQVVFGIGDEPTLDAAAARMEQYHDNKPIPKNIGQTLGRIAVDAIADLDRHDDPRIAQDHLQRADELIKQFLCADHAYRNTLSRMAFEQRLGRLGKAITAAVKDTSDETIAACEMRLHDIAGHRLAKPGRNTDQVSNAEMAVRLVRWLKQPSQDPTSFDEHASYHVREMSFVDWAREPLCRGEDVPDLSAAYQLLDQTVLKFREEMNCGFAKSLADWTSVGSKETGVHGVEDVLGDVVSKVVEAGNKVLFVVLDGMSWAVCRELLEDIRKDHWFESTLDESGKPPLPVVATIPSVTNYSRASLLSGLLTHGAQDVEERNFREHKALAKTCDKRYPPVLFHKNDLTEGNRGSISESLSKKVLSQVHKVVGVVINAIDDRLANAQQVIDRWSLSRISPLGSLLRLARDSGRVVILASDHGHVWHRPDGRNRRHDESSRWRVNDGKCHEDEIVIEGERVVVGGNTIIVPWSESVYYKSQHNGYHGGATSQEMVCPLILLTDKTSAYSRLSRCEYPKPDWWSSAPTASPSVDEPQITITVPEKLDPPTLFDLELEEQPVTKSKQVGQPTKSEENAADWIAVLLSSDAYKNQRAMIRRHPVDDAVMAACLSALNASGGIMTPTAFAKAAEVSMARLDGLIVKMQRVLNVDGYEILTMDWTENRVELNLGKLKRQFDLD